ncbi:hypothetical protein AAMO2058_000773800 [Amorphochlora amoebiformis]
MARTQIGTPYYLSPEICKNKPYNAKSDMWAVGVVMYELTSLRHPFTANSMEALVNRICNRNPPPLSRNYSSNLRNTIVKLLNKRPSSRPAVNAMLSKKWFRSQIQRFLSSAMIQEEFSHTIIHGNVPLCKASPNAAEAAEQPSNEDKREATKALKAQRQQAAEIEAAVKREAAKKDAELRMRRAAYAARRKAEKVAEEKRRQRRESDMLEAKRRGEVRRREAERRRDAEKRRLLKENRQRDLARKAYDNARAAAADNQRRGAAVRRFPPAPRPPWVDVFPPTEKEATETEQQKPSEEDSSLMARREHMREFLQHLDSPEPNLVKPNCPEPKASSSQHEKEKESPYQPSKGTIRRAQMREFLLRNHHTPISTPNHQKPPSEGQVVSSMGRNSPSEAKNSPTGGRDSPGRRPLESCEVDGVDYDQQQRLMLSHAIAAARLREAQAYVTPDVDMDRAREPYSPLDYQRRNIDSREARARAEQQKIQALRLAAREVFEARQRAKQRKYDPYKPSVENRMVYGMRDIGGVGGVGESRAEKAKRERARVEMLKQAAVEAHRQRQLNRQRRYDPYAPSAENYAAHRSPGSGCSSGTGSPMGIASKDSGRARESARDRQIREHEEALAQIRQQNLQDKVKRRALRAENVKEPDHSRKKDNAPRDDRRGSNLVADVLKSKEEAKKRQLQEHEEALARIRKENLEARRKALERQNSTTEESDKQQAKAMVILAGSPAIHNQISSDPRRLVFERRLQQRRTDNNEPKHSIPEEERTGEDKNDQPSQREREERKKPSYDPEDSLAQACAEACAERVRLQALRQKSSSPGPNEGLKKFGSAGKGGGRVVVDVRGGGGGGNLAAKREAFEKRRRKREERRKKEKAAKETVVEKKSDEREKASEKTLKKEQIEKVVPSVPTHSPSALCGDKTVRLRRRRTPTNDGEATIRRIPNNNPTLKKSPSEPQSTPRIRRSLKRSQSIGLASDLHRIKTVGRRRRDSGKVSSARSKRESNEGTIAKAERERLRSRYNALCHVLRLKDHEAESGLDLQELQMTLVRAEVALGKLRAAAKIFSRRRVDLFSALAEQGREAKAPIAPDWAEEGDAERARALFLGSADQIRWLVARSKKNIKSEDDIVGLVTGLNAGIVCLSGASRLANANRTELIEEWREITRHLPADTPKNTPRLPKEKTKILENSGGDRQKEVRTKRNVRNSPGCPSPGCPPPSPQDYPDSGPRNVSLMGLSPRDSLKKTSEKRRPRRASDSPAITNLPSTEGEEEKGVQDAEDEKREAEEFISMMENLRELVNPKLKLNSSPDEESETETEGEEGQATPSSPLPPSPIKSTPKPKPSDAVTPKLSHGKKRAEVLVCEDSESDDGDMTFEVHCSVPEARSKAKKLGEKRDGKNNSGVGVDTIGRKKKDVPVTTSLTSMRLDG